MDFNKQTIRLLNRVAQNAEMGKHAAQDLADAAQDAPMKRALLRQVQGYEDVQNRARAMLAVGGEEPKDENPVAKFSAKVGVKMKTAADASTHSLAKMVMAGSRMGRQDLHKALRENPGANPGAEALARRLCQAEEHWEAQMREFL